MISERLIKLRKIFKPNSASAFANELGLKQATYSNYENSIRCIPDDVYQKLVEKYNVNLNWLIAGKGEMFISEKTKDEDFDKKVEQKVTEILKNMDWNSK